MEATSGPTAARDRLIAAARELVAANGFKGATTRAIAERSEVAEVTLFRLFGSKAELVAEAFSTLVAGFESAAREPTADVESDLLAAAHDFHDLVRAEGGAFVPLLAELSRVPELGDVARGSRRRLLGRFLKLVAHHRRAGALVGESAEAITLAFVGPLMATARSHDLFGADVQLDPVEHVRCFLDGRRAR